jgi:hypothetical protein
MMDGALQQGTELDNIVEELYISITILENIRRRFIVMK